nr:hypothetical protein Q903MT_gene439 [Picea sitchensis]
MLYYETFSIFCHSLRRSTLRDAISPGALDGYIVSPSGKEGKAVEGKAGLHAHWTFTIVNLRKATKCPIGLVLIGNIGLYLGPEHTQPL